LVVENEKLDATWVTTMRHVLLHVLAASENIDNVALVRIGHGLGNPGRRMVSWKQPRNTPICKSPTIPSTTTDNNNQVSLSMHPVTHLFWKPPSSIEVVAVIIPVVFHPQQNPDQTLTISSS